MSQLRRNLYEWRAWKAQTEGVELFRILPNATLEALSLMRPKTLEDLMSIKGIKEAKAHLYGKELLQILSGEEYAREDVQLAVVGSPDGTPTYSVSVFLDILHRAVAQYNVRVVGETLEIKRQGNYVYFSLIDPVNRSTLRVMLPKSVEALSGIELLDGMTIGVTGHAGIYKPRGTLSLYGEAIELIGEGPLKKAYDALKKKLQSEGLFEDSRKKIASEYPVRIGLLTSKTGAVIHDFESNLGRYGFHVIFKDSRVEGAQAVPDLLSGLRVMKKQSLDVLVIIRGGGSMESLQPFNNEQVVRAIADFPVPVICAIGHDKDVPLAQLAASYAPSTPTATTEILNRSWREAIHLSQTFGESLISQYQNALWGKKESLRIGGEKIRYGLKYISRLMDEADGLMNEIVLHLGASLSSSRVNIGSLREHMLNRLKYLFSETERSIAEGNALLHMHNPGRQLRLGYSILSRGGKIIRTRKQIPSGGDFEARLSDGTLRAIRTDE